MISNNQFTIHLEITNKNCTTLFTESYRYFTVPRNSRMTWINDEGIGKYNFFISDKVKEKYKDIPEIHEILSSIEIECSDPYMKISYNAGKERQVYGQRSYDHYRCQISDLLLQKIKLLFISSYVYGKEKKELENKEYMTLLFDVETQKVELQDLFIYFPTDNPYLNYARKAATHTSFDSIFDQDNEKKKVVNFYSYCGQWLPVEKLDNIKEEIYNVIYMLYDENNNLFYVGKAKRLLERLNAHRVNNNCKEPIPNFTHFRYSQIADGYEDYIYLIENATIHDCAWLINMPKAKKYKPALGKKIESKIINGDMNTMKIVNTVERQTRLAQQKK